MTYESTREYESTAAKLANPDNWDRDGIIDDVIARLRDTDPEAAAVMEWLADRASWSDA